mgnify:CR=1 FL=1
MNHLRPNTLADMRILIGLIPSPLVAAGDVDGGVPADVAASEGGDAGFAVAGEDPLLTVFVLKVADVKMRFALSQDWWTPRMVSLHG